MPPFQKGHRHAPESLRKIVTAIRARPQKPLGSIRVKRQGRMKRPYAMLKVGPGKTGWIPRYRHVMCQKLGRALLPGEEVHHKNGDTMDDRVENLILTSRAEHASRHHRGKSSLKAGQWSRAGHTRCIVCGTTQRKHLSRGMCRSCYEHQSGRKR